MAITREDISILLKNYDCNNLTVAALGGHSCLDVCHGAKQQGFNTLALVKKGREKTYNKYYATSEGEGCVDETIVLDNFSDVTKPEIVSLLQEKNTILTSSRYWWVYFDDFSKVENDLLVPIHGTRDMVKLEERDCTPVNQYDILKQAGIRIPKIFNNPSEIDSLVIVKANESIRGYERAFFFASSPEQYQLRVDELLQNGTITEDSLKNAVIEEFILGAQVNLNFFYSPLSDQLELMGTDMRRQTSLDGFLRLPADAQSEILKLQQPKLIETGHVAVTMKESLLEKAFELGENFVKTSKEMHPEGIIGAFALQGAVDAGKGHEDFVIFDVSMRIPGSPGTPFTPYSSYLHGSSMSFGQRIGLELKRAVESNRLNEIVT